VRVFRTRRRGTGQARPFTGTIVFLVITGIVAVAFMSISGANLAPSTFEGNDGDLAVTTAGNTDWVNAPNRVVGVDQPTGATDNAFGQGTKEDIAGVSVVAGSIPPNKSDLTRFYEASEFVNGKNYLYLAWERSNVLGSANMDFEVNQNTTPAFKGSFTGPITLNRTAGDVLITFDFSGSGAPSLGLLRWITTGSTSQCFSASALPCWGKRVNLSSSGYAEGAVNSATVTDPIPPGSSRSLPAGTFGEAAINLTDAGVFPAAGCTTFGSAFLKSRSSSSFTAEVKDFVAPQSVDVSNCGTITIHKTTENGDGSFGFTTIGTLTPATFSLSNGGSQTYTNVTGGTYTVTESSTAGWALRSLSCTSTGSGTSASTSVSTATATITIAGGGTADCTFTNHTRVTPTIATVLSATSVAIGTAVNDTSTLTGATSNAGGTVTYTVYTDSGCSAGAQSAGTKSVTNGLVLNSDPVTFNAAGTYYWQAVYSGDLNNNGASSPCTDEQLVVNPNTTGITTAQTILPNDSSTISGATGNAAGSVTFQLFGPADSTCGGTPAYSQTVNVSGAGTYSTTNTGFSATTPGTWQWKVTYSGDSNNSKSTSACGVEKFTITNG
jgi:hypothetical protein